MSAVPAMRRYVALVLLGLLTCGAGLPEPAGYRLSDYRAAVPDTVAGGTVIHTAALKDLLQRPGIVLIDVLPAPRRPPNIATVLPWMPVPRQDIPGTVWLPDTGRGALSAEFEAAFKAQLTHLTGGDFGRPIVFYCLSRCWMSWNATRRAVSYGYTRAMWYPDGSDGWAGAGLPTVVVHPAFEGGPGAH